LVKVITFLLAIVKNSMLYRIISGKTFSKPSLSVREMLSELRKHFFANRTIKQYITSLPAGDEIRIVFGSHWCAIPRWLVLGEAEQDITKRLKFASNSVNAIFTEHVIEHIECQEAINFMRESHRILKKSGILRIVCPVTDMLYTNFSLESKNDSRYLQENIAGKFQPAIKSLQQLGLSGIYEDIYPFLICHLVGSSGHKFVWSSKLLLKVLKAIGYSSVQQCNIGQGSNPAYCLERRSRIIATENWKSNLSDPIYDPESGIFEAKK
jgi:hypothetical protein